MAFLYYVTTRLNEIPAVKPPRRDAFVVAVVVLVLVLVFVGVVIVVFFVRGSPRCVLLAASESKQNKGRTKENQTAAVVTGYLSMTSSTEDAQSLVVESKLNSDNNKRSLLKVGWLPAALQSFATSCGVPRLNEVKGWWVYVYEQTSGGGGGAIELDFTLEKAKKNKNAIKLPPKRIDLRDYDRTHGSRWEEGFREWHQQKDPCYRPVEYYTGSSTRKGDPPIRKSSSTAVDAHPQHPEADGETDEEVGAVSGAVATLSLNNSSAASSSSSSSTLSSSARAVYFRDFEKAMLHYLQKAVYVVGWCPWITSPKLLKALSLKKGVCVLLWEDPTKRDEVHRVSDFARKYWTPWPDYDGSCFVLSPLHRRGDCHTPIVASSSHLFVHRQQLVCRSFGTRIDSSFHCCVHTSTSFARSF